MKKIALIGCGDTGSRHLQALSKSKFPLDVYVIEPNQKSVEIAKKRLLEVGSNYRNFKWFTDLSMIEEDFDLTIVATTANNRSDIIINLIEKKHKNFLIEKIVCQSSKEYESIMQKINDYNCNAWVNLGRRYFPAYQEIQSVFKNSSKLSMSVTGGDFGLATNALHYIDLFSWLSGSYEVSLDGELLSDSILPNKRGDEFVEFTGIIGGKTQNCVFTLNDCHMIGMPQIITISDGIKKIIIDETNEKTLFINVQKQISFKLDIASNLNTRIIDDILDDNDCILPTLNDSKSAHLELFRIFNQHLNNIKNEKFSLCPIT